jgi:hypothetical protein
MERCMLESHGSGAELKNRKSEEEKHQIVAYGHVSVSLFPLKNNSAKSGTVAAGGRPK